MKFTEFLIISLEKNGLSQDQASKVMEFANDDLLELEDTHGFKLNSNVEDYPPIIAKLLFLNLKTIALKWIELNIPQAWFKPMFQ